MAVLAAGRCRVAVAAVGGSLVCRACCGEEAPGLGCRGAPGRRWGGWCCGCASVAAVAIAAAVARPGEGAAADAEGEERLGGCWLLGLRRLVLGLGFRLGLDL